MVLGSKGMFWSFTTHLFKQNKVQNLCDDVLIETCVFSFQIAPYVWRDFWYPLFIRGEEVTMGPLMSYKSWDDPPSRLGSWHSSPQKNSKFFSMFAKRNNRIITTVLRWCSSFRSPGEEESSTLVWDVPSKVKNAQWALPKTWNSGNCEGHLQKKIVFLPTITGLATPTIKIYIYIPGSLAVRRWQRMLGRRSLSLYGPPKISGRALFLQGSTWQKELTNPPCKWQSLHA